MNRRYSEAASVVEFALEMGKRLSQVLSDGLPDEARHHLLNAQRELITALVIMYEHQAGARRTRFEESRSSSTRPPAGTRRRRAEPAGKARSTHIPVD